MNKIGLLGCGRLGKRFSDLEKKNNIYIEAYADNYCSGSVFEEHEVVDVKRLFQLYENGKIDTVIIAIISDEQRTEVGIQLLDMGIKDKDIFFVPEWLTNLPVEPIPDVMVEIIPFRMMKPTLQYLDIPVVDYCNLNCRCCWMGCNLVEHGQATSIEQYCRDMKQLSQKYYNIESIHFMGGEPFLHKDLSKYVCIASETFPRAELFVTTNGLLIENLPDEIFDTLRKYDVLVFISFYPAMKNRIYSTIKKLVEKGIRFYVSPEKTEFLKIFSFAEQDVDKTRSKCPSTKCHYLQEGKLYGCGVPITMRRLSKIVNLPWCEEEIGCDIYGTEDGWDMRRKLDNAFSTCKHCTADMEPITWKNVGKDVDITDWFVDEP